MATIKINGMTCNHCAMAVTKAFDAIEGITNAKVDLEKARAVYDETTPVDLNRVKEAIKKAGYQVV